MSKLPSKFRVPSYRRHKPSKQAVVTLNGKDVYLGRYGTEESHEAYRREIQKYLEAKGQEVPPEVLAARRPSKNLTVVEAADRYLAWSLTHHAKAEQAHVKSMLRCLVGVYENERAAAIGPVALREVRRAMIARDWSRNYVNEQVARVNRMYQWLAGEELVPASVHVALRVVRGLKRGEENVRESAPARVVADDDVDATISRLAPNAGRSIFSRDAHLR